MVFTFERSFKKTAAFEGEGNTGHKRKGKLCFIERFFYYHSGNQKSDYGYQITLPQKKSLDQSLMRKKGKRKKKFTQVLFYAHNSISFSNMSICSWFLNLVFELNAQEP